MFPFQQLDESVLRWIAENLRVPVLDGVMKLYTSLGNAGLLFIAAAVVLLIFRKTRRAGIAAAISLAADVLAVNVIIKPLVSRPRPWIVMEEFVPLLTSSDAHSFPSGHTCAAFAFAVAVCLTAPKKWMKAAALAAAALMGFSRLYVGVHFPSDVLAGVVIGALCGIFGSWVSKKISRRFPHLTA